MGVQSPAGRSGRGGRLDALNAPFFKRGDRVKAESGRWSGEVGTIIGVTNPGGTFGQTRHWQPRYTVEFLHGTWETDGRDLASF